MTGPGVPGEPYPDLIESGVAAAHQGAVTSVIGVGGGALDTRARLSGLPGLDARGVNGDHRRRVAAMAAVSTSMKASPVPSRTADQAGLMECAR